MPSSNRPQIRMHCPQCLAELEFDRDLAGQRVACPQCRFSLQVPAATTAGANLFEDLFGEPSAAEPEIIPDEPEFAPTDLPADLRPVEGPSSDPVAVDFSFQDLPGPASAPPPQPTADPRGNPPAPARRPADPPRAKGNAPTSSSRPQQPKAPPPARPAPSAPVAPDAAVGPAPPPAADLSIPSDTDLLGPAVNTPSIGETAPAITASGATGPFPVAPDPDAPLKIEGLEAPDTGSGDVVSVRCRVCDAGIVVSASQLGTTIVCPDCGSKVEVSRSRVPKQVLPGWAQPTDWREMVRAQEEEEYRLATPVERAEVRPVPMDWGLGESRETSSPARRSVEMVFDEDGEDVLPGAPLERRVDETTVASSPFLGGALAAQKQTQRRTSQGKAASATARPGAPAEPARTRTDSPAVAGAAAMAPASRPSAEPRGDSRQPSDPDRNPEEGAADDGEGIEQRFPIKLENLGAFDGSEFAWIRAVAADRNLWARWAIATLALGLSSWMFWILVGALREEKPDFGMQVFRIVFPGVVGGIAFVASAGTLLVTAGPLFVQSGDRRPGYRNWPGLGPGDWGQATLFLLMGLGIGAIPGMVIGVPLLLTALYPLGVGAISLSAAVLGPPLLLAAWYNGSPWQVWSKEVFGRFRTRGEQMLKYLPSCLGSWLLGVIGLGIAYIPLPGTSFLGAAMQVAGVLLFASFAGLYCGLVSRRMERESG